MLNKQVMHENIPEGASPLRAGVTLRTVSKSQAGLLWGKQWRKRDYKLRYWRTGTAYEAINAWISKHIIVTSYN